jgi:hypothetical protein
VFIAYAHLLGDGMAVAAVWTAYYVTAVTGIFFVLILTTLIVVFCSGKERRDSALEALAALLSAFTDFLRLIFRVRK